MNAHTVTIPDALYRRLQQQAHAMRTSVDEVARQTLARHLVLTVPVEDDLPEDLEAELKAMAQLSDETLWLLARGAMPSPQHDELEALNSTAHQRRLTDAEKGRQTELLEVYERVLLRRAHAIALLQARGYDVSDPAVLRSA